MTGLFPLWHLAHLADWRAAQPVGEYRISTRGRTLDEEGFIHCSYPHQLGVVARALYADDPEPLVLLEIDRDVLAAHDTLVRTEAIGTGGVAYPHVYGPLPVTAVLEVRVVEFDDEGNLLLGDPLTED